MPISTKLNLLILAFPIFLMVSIFLVGFYFYRSSFDASAFATAVSSLTSAILVILLVWERLRDSLSKKMEYFHNSIFLNLLSKFRSYNDLWYPLANKDIELLRIDLRRYGKFMTIRLFPKDLLKEIDEFLPLHIQFLGNVEQIFAMVKEKYPLTDSDKPILFYNLGFEVYYSKPTEEKEKELTVISASYKKDRIVVDTNSLYWELRVKGEHIYRDIEDFLKCNDLKLE